MAERNKYNGAIKILTGRDEWPIFKEFIANKIRIISLMNNTPIETEADKAKHNVRVGFINGLAVITTIEQDIENADKWEASIEKRIKEAEIHNKQRGINNG